MAYSAEIGRSNPTLFVFLLDQSGSMREGFGAGEVQLRKADFLADVVNRTLHDLVIRCTRTEEIRDYYYVSMLGYGATKGEVTSAFSGQLQGRTLVKVSDIGEYPARLEDRVKKVPDGAGGLVDQTVRFPIWLDALGAHDTPMCAALQQVKGVVESWLGEHPHCFPPVVLHITDGHSTDGDPSQPGKAVTELASSDGSVLLFNCHISSTRSPSVSYPADGSTLPDDFARTIFNISSVMPPAFCQAAQQSGLNVAEGSRGFVFNADAAALVHFFDIGTRPANLR